MILINEALIIESETDLVEFLADVKNNLPEQDKDKVFECISGYLWEVWDNSQKLENHLQRALSDTIRPLVVVNIGNTEDLSLLEFRAVSTEEDMKISKRQELIFDQLCHKYFSKMVSLFDRFANVS